MTRPNRCGRRSHLLASRRAGATSRVRSSTSRVLACRSRATDARGRAPVARPPAPAPGPVDLPHDRGSEYGRNVRTTCAARLIRVRRAGNGRIPFESFFTSEPSSRASVVFQPSRSSVAPSTAKCGTTTASPHPRRLSFTSCLECRGHNILLRKWCKTRGPDVKVASQFVCFVQRQTRAVGASRRSPAVEWRVCSHETVVKTRYRVVRSHRDVYPCLAREG